jgi:hypothetical protein
MLRLLMFLSSWPRCLVGIAFALAAAGANAGDVFVIANGVTAMTPEEVKEVFLGEVQFAASLKLQPVDNAAVQADFQSRVLRMAPAKYTASWTKKAFRDGLNAPPVKGSDAEVIGFVKATPGAIGYVSSAPGPGVAVLGRY